MVTSSSFSIPVVQLFCNCSSMSRFQCCGGCSTCMNRSWLVSNALAPLALIYTLSGCGV